MAVCNAQWRETPVHVLEHRKHYLSNITQVVISVDIHQTPLRSICNEVVPTAPVNQAGTTNSNFIKSHEIYWNSFSSLKLQIDLLPWRIVEAQEQDVIDYYLKNFYILILALHAVPHFEKFSHKNSTHTLKM